MNKSNLKSVFHVFSRELVGKKVSSIRKSGYIPANIYGPGLSPTTIQVPTISFIKFYEKTGESGLIYLKIDDKSQEIPALIDEVQFDTVTLKPLHVVFRQVSLTEKVSTEIAILLEGENKVQESNVVQVLDEIEVSALPTDLPENFVVDISQLTEIGQTITIADLNIDRSKVEIVFSGDMDESSPLVILQEVKEEVEPEEVEVEVEEEGAEQQSDKEDQSPAGQTSSEPSDAKE